MCKRAPDRAGPLLVITPGDPIGIGAEVAVKALIQTGVDALVVGDPDAFLGEARRQGLGVGFADRVEAGLGVRFLEPPPGPDPVEIRALQVAVKACQEHGAGAVVTGPVHKARLAASGFPFPGHTDYLAVLCGTRDPVMAFVGRSLRMALVTHHLPLARVPGAITRQLVLHVLRTAHRAVQSDLGVPQPRVAVCGLNPHAGDGGVLGREELEVIGPACEEARAEGAVVLGPVSAETAIRWACDGTADLVVAMYHDQGLAPLKALDFGHSVNWTLGLPIIRTSVDHGTGDDIAGRGVADAGSMVAALDLARSIAARRANHP